MGARQEDLKAFEAETARLRKVRLHTRISYWKSGFRLMGYIFLPFNLWWAAGTLVFSELLGIAEEVWGA